MARLNFDGDPKKLVRTALDDCKEHQQSRNYQYKRNDQLYHSFVDMTARDPDRANVFIPKTFNAVETIVPRHIHALHNARPYIPFDAIRKEYADVARDQVTLLDEYLYRAGFLAKRILQTKIAVIHGTAFMEALPYYADVVEKQFDEQQQQVVAQTVKHLRLRLRVYAPWEVYVDPYATGLEEKDQCRYVIKIELISRRQIVDLVKDGAYEGFDPDTLYAHESTASTEKQDHWGLQMLEEIGLTRPEEDDDMGILLRYESPDRYIELWNGEHLLRDIGNPFWHGRINLSRLVHTMAPHTQNAFWGIGVVKPTEILQHILNDTWCMTLDNHNLINQGVIYYRDGAVNPDAIVKTPGNRIEISQNFTGPIKDAILDVPGSELPSSHYIIPEITESQMDMTNGVYDMIRGETPEKQGTAAEAGMRREAGEIRLSLDMRLQESFLADLGGKCLCHTDQFTNFDDRVEILGEERAMGMFTANPIDIPGGFNFQFAGADKVANLLVQQRNMRELSPIVLQVDNVLKGWWVRKLLEKHELSDLDLDEGIIPDEVMYQIRQEEQQVMIQGGQAQLPEQTKSNNTVKEAQQTAKQAAQV